jgi:hypothetical protein
MAELVDALVSGTSILGCGGSSPLPGTSNFNNTKYTGFLKQRLVVLLAFTYLCLIIGILKPLSMQFLPILNGFKIPNVDSKQMY